MEPYDKRYFMTSLQHVAIYGSMQLEHSETHEEIRARAESLLSSLDPPKIGIWV
jgi:hypothetical protein